MPQKRFIPDQDGQFHFWFQNYWERINADPARYGVSPADLADLNAAYTDWEVDYPAHTTAQSTARAAAEKKNNTRDSAETVARRITKFVQQRKETTNQHREELRITVADTVKTPLSEQIVQSTPPPVIEAKCTGPKTVRIAWYPTQDPGESEALPEGIDGVNIWAAEGGIPSDESQWRFLAMDTNSPYVHNVANDVTVTMAYKAQWFDRRKRMGPFGTPVTVAVTT
ncbi:MAG: hypothetical protein AB1599_05320 [Planctomycetota bacterium]